MTGWKYILIYSILAPHNIFHSNPLFFKTHYVGLQNLVPTYLANGFDRGFPV